MPSCRGICILCDKNIPRNKFTNIKQVETDNYDIALLSQIYHSQVEINSDLKNNKNEKISIIENIYSMAKNNFVWNGNFDVVVLDPTPKICDM